MRIAYHWPKGFDAQELEPLCASKLRHPPMRVIKCGERPRRGYCRRCARLLREHPNLWNRARTKGWPVPLELDGGAKRVLVWKF